MLAVALLLFAAHQSVERMIRGNRYSTITIAGQIRYDLAEVWSLNPRIESAFPNSGTADHGQDGVD